MNTHAAAPASTPRPIYMYADRSAQLPSASTSTANRRTLFTASRAVDVQGCTLGKPNVLSASDSENTDEALKRTQKVSLSRSILTPPATLYQTFKLED